jgi:hypothetical protein
MPPQQFTFAAPWSGVLRLVSIASTVLLLTVAGLTSRFLEGWNNFLLASVLGLLIGCALFTIRGYHIERRTLLVKRLFWSTDIPLAHLESVTCDPEAMKGSIRLCGNGGLYSFSGLFRNKRLGNYRAFVTAPKNAVVLRFRDKNPIVVSPSDPAAFTAAINAGGATPAQEPSDRR